MEYNMGVFGILNIDDMKNQPLFLLDGGIENRFKEDYEFFNDKRPEYKGYLFQYTLEGKGIFERDGCYREVDKGMCFFVKFPDKSRYYLPQKSEVAWEFLYLHFDGEAVRPFFDKLNEICECPFKLDFNSIPIRMILKFQNNMMERKGINKYEGGEFLYKFLCALLREIEHPTGRDINTMIRKAEIIMKDEYGMLESIEDLASRFEVSLEHFTRKFKAEIGITPIRYLTNLRIQSSINDLLNTNENLEAIANKNGFSSGNYFCKVFRKSVGMSPIEYRKSKKGK